MRDPLILHLECTTKLCAVGVSRGEEVLASKEEWCEEYQHSESLHQFVREVAFMAQIDLGKLDAVSVSQGPGSYTGLRIAYGTAKGLAYALDIPMIAVPTLDAVARFGLVSSLAMEKCIATIDARRDEVYLVELGLGDPVKKAEAVILTESSFASLKDSKVLFAGEAKDKCRRLVTDWSSSWQVSEDPLMGVSPMVMPALEKFANEDFEDLAYCEPFYLKEFQPGKKKKKP